MDGMGKNIVRGVIAAVFISVVFGGSLVGALVYFLVSKASC